MALSSETPAESLPSTVIEPAVWVIEPWKAAGPVTRTPTRLVPTANCPSRSPSESVSFSTVLSSTTIDPDSFTSPVLPPTMATPVALSASEMAIAPSRVTLLLLLRVKAVPPIGLMEPAVVTRTSSRAPLAAVAVAMGVVTAVAIAVSAQAGAPIRHRGEAAASRR